MIGPDGTVRNEHVADASMIAQALTWPGRFPERSWSSRIQPAVDHAKTGKFREALAVLKAATAEDAEDAKVLSKYIEDQGLMFARMCEASLEAGDYMSALAHADLAAKLLPETAACMPRLAKVRKTLEEDPTAKKVVACKADYEKAYELMRTDPPKAAQLMKRCAEACKGTKFGKQCEVAEEMFLHIPMPEKK